MTFWCPPKAARKVTLVRGRPLRTTESRIVVHAGLAPGRHRFQLQVVDTGGLRSVPATAGVLVARGGITPAPPQPSPPIHAVTPRHAPTPTDSGSNR